MGKLKELRKEIDEIDEQLIKVFLDRMNVVSKIAAHKEQNNIATYDKGREEKIFEKINNLNLDIELENGLKELFASILTISKNFQKKNQL